jgi:hypothetical protein
MASATSGRKSLVSFAGAPKPRVFILTDITNEPDDAESFCRYLTYANQFQTEGIVPTTSTWLRDRVAPEALHEIADAYAKVVDNLQEHAHPDSPYPSAQHVKSLIKSGPPVRCRTRKTMTAFKTDEPSPRFMACSLWAMMYR